MAGATMTKGPLVGRRFETILRTSISCIEGMIGYKLPVGKFERYQCRPPFDFMLFYRGQCAAVEAKAFSTLNSFSFSRLDDNQLKNLILVAGTGNRAYILFGYMGKEKRVWAMTVDTFLSMRKKTTRASMTVEEIALNSHSVRKLKKGGWDLSELFGEEQRFEEPPRKEKKA
jgi:penicillin-binding protein-related factor A (putative recombinase)